MEGQDGRVKNINTIDGEDGEDALVGELPNCRFVLRSRGDSGGEIMFSLYIYI